MDDMNKSKMQSIFNRMQKSKSIIEFQFKHLKALQGHYKHLMNNIQISHDGKHLYYFLNNEMYNIHKAFKKTLKKIADTYPNENQMSHEEAPVLYMNPLEQTVDYAVYLANARLDHLNTDEIFIRKTLNVLNGLGNQFLIQHHIIKRMSPDSLKLCLTKKGLWLINDGMYHVEVFLTYNNFNYSPDISYSDILYRFIMGLKFINSHLRYCKYFGLMFNLVLLNDFTYHQFNDYYNSDNTKVLHLEPTILKATRDILMIIDNLFTNPNHSYLTSVKSLSPNIIKYVANLALIDKSIKHYCENRHHPNNNDGNENNHHNPDYYAQFF